MGKFAFVQQESILYELSMRFLVESLEQRQTGECLEGELMYEYIVLRQAVLDLQVYRYVNCEYFLFSSPEFPTVLDCLILSENVVGI